MSPAAWAALGAAIGPVLAFLTWFATRPRTTRIERQDSMSRVLDGALATTEMMRLLVEPLENEIRLLRQEIQVLRVHVNSLEQQVRHLGDEPLPPPQIEGM